MRESMADVFLNKQVSFAPSMDYNTNFFQIPLVSMDDIFSCLLTLTSYLTKRLIRLIENLGVRDIRWIDDSSITIHDHDAVNQYLGDFACAPGGFAPSSHFSTCKSHCGIEDLYSGLKDHTVYSNTGNVESSYSYGGIPDVLEGLMLPKFALRFLSIVALKSWTRSQCCLRYAQSRVFRFMSKVRITLQGSSHDIGWLQNHPEMEPTEDGSERFLELLLAIRNGEHSLPDSYLYLLVPGLFSNHGPLYFMSTKRALSRMGLACHIAKIHSEASVERNAWELKHYIEELYWGSGKRVMLLGHSKGGVDAAAALVMYREELEGKVAGLALVQSPYGGSAVASDILREGQIADKEARRIMEFICKLVKGDIQSLEDLTYEKRKEFISKYKHPANIPLISFHSEAGSALEVFHELSHVAHAELPYLPLPDFRSKGSVDAERAPKQVPVIVPVSAVLAISALHLQLRYGEKSDGLVTCCDAEVPGSVVVKPDRKLDHAWMVYSSWNKNPSEPDSSHMCEALLTMLVQLGETRKYEAQDGST